MRIVAMIVLAAVLVLPGAAMAQVWLDQPGASGSAVAEIGFARVKLPPGEWTLASHQSWTNTGEGIPLLSQTYYQTDGPHIVALAYVTSNGSLATSHKGFRPPGDCFRNDVFVHENEDLYPGQFRCLTVNHVMMTWNGNPSPVWRETIAKVAPFAGLPHTMITAAVQMASPDRMGFLTVTIYFNPASAGIVSNAATAWRDSDWHRDYATPDHVAYLNKVATWARAYRPVVAASWN